MSPDNEHRHRDELAQWPRAWRKRIFEVAQVFARFGLRTLLHDYHLGRYLPKIGLNRVPDEADASLTIPARVRLALQELGVVGIKIGQFFSNRGDVLPRELVAELRRLQDDVEPFPFSQVKQIIEAELNADLTELFAEFDEEPAAAASIGQVHYAKLPDGRRVAVKVQRPGIQQTVDRDLRIVVRLAQETERFIRWCAEVEIGNVAVEFAQSLRDELNYSIEAHHTDRLRKNLEGEDTVTVPHVYWGLSSRRVLTTERIDGVKPTDRSGLAKAEVNGKLAAGNLARVMLRQVFMQGYFHGDPHAGNVLIQSGERIALLDCGNAVAMGPELREGLVQMMMAILQQDTTEVIDQLLLIGIATEATSMQRLRADVDRLISRYGSLSASDVSISEVIDDLMAVVFRHRVRMPAAFASLTKALIVTEGVCVTLDPSFDFREGAAEVGKEALVSEISLEHALGDIRRFARDIGRFATVLPRQMNQLLTRAQGPGLRVHVRNDDIDRHIRRIDVMFSRLSLGLVASAIIVGSAFILSSDRASQIITYPVSVAYVIVGALLGGWLVYSIWRSGRL
jgi:ubiquinone biosynthesis protein